MSIFKSFRKLLLTAGLSHKLSRILATPARKCHRQQLTITRPDMKVNIVPALKDNYMYLLIDESTNQCAAVDPVSPQQIMSAVKDENVKLTCVLTTHHHWDHASGNEELVKLVPDIDVYGGDNRIPSITKKVSHKQEIKLGNLTIKCLHTPCHTSGHFCYYVTSKQGHQPVVFTGDTLFIGGCGKFFEGTPGDMLHSLLTVLAALPRDTLVFCGHEYTVDNLKFANTVEPNNKAIQDKITWAKEQMSQGKPTIPSTLEEEFLYNPFMRVGEEALQKYSLLTDPVQVMELVRSMKDKFKA
ncbi:hydroxyacylglutathione hydrolase, mitochondrial-like isoform X2 [Argonauta hians]